MKTHCKLKVWCKCYIFSWFAYRFGICFLFFTVTFPLTAQNLPFHEYTVSDGLPQTQARSLYQDSRGFIWIITRNGISRFDGIEFKNFFRKDGLPTNIIAQIFEDNEGYIWALSTNGLSKYDGYTFKYFPYRDELFYEGFRCANNLGDTILLLLNNPDPLHNRLICFRNGEYFNYTTRNNILDTLSIEWLYFDKTSGYFILLDSYNNIWKWRNEEIIPFKDIKINEIRNDRGKIILESDENYYEIYNGGIIPYQFVNNSGRTEITEGKAEKGDFIQLYKDGVITKIYNLYYSSILIDNESNIWFGSEVNMYRLISDAFYFYSEEDGLPKETWAIAEDKNGHKWFGSLTGDLLEFDGEKFILRNEYKKLFGGYPAFFKGSIRGSDGIVYFSLNKGVLKWDGVTFSRLTGLPYETQVCIIYEDPDDKSIFLGTGDGLFHLKKGKMEFFSEFNPAKYGIIEGIVKDDKGMYWLSGQKGIILFDGKNIYPFNDPLKPSGYTYTLVKDNRGGIWITSEEGLFFKSKSSAGLSHGLPEELNTTTNSIIIMDTSYIMVGRMSDICILNIDKFYNNDPDYFKIYDKTYGFPGSECLDNGIIKDKEGIYWILTSGKAVVLDARKLRINKYPPKISVTDIEYEADSLEWKSLQMPDLFYSRQNEIRINRRQNNLKFRFTGISTTNPVKVMYQSRLIGVENIWSGKNYEREVVYKNLKPGEYDFQLKAINSDGIETSEIYSLKFKIIPDFWQTLPFKAFVTFSVIMLIVLLTRWITKRNISKKNEETRLKNELSHLQMNSVVRQFDPHFTFNAISSVGSLIMKGEKETAYNYILKLSGLLRTVLSDGSIIVRPLSEEIDFVRRYCELQKLRFKERLTFIFDIGENINLQRLVPKMTIQTFVENSIKHGIGNRIEGGKIVIRIRKINDYIEITITDNGIGRKAAGSFATKGGGIGLKTINNIFDFMNRFNRTKSRIEIIDLIDGENAAEGTVVHIDIPDDYTFESHTTYKLT